MTIRIPSSLKWLINKHARLAAQIKNLEIQLVEQGERYQELLWNNRRAEEDSAQNIHHIQIYLKQLKTDIEVIDSTLLLHDIPINPQVIAPINTQMGLRHLPHGAITKLTFVYLKQAKCPKTTSDIYTFIRANVRNDISAFEEKELRFSVRKRLKTLHAKNKIKLVSQVRTSLEGRWVLAEWDYIGK